MKKIFILFLLSTILCGCDSTTTDSQTYVSRAEKLAQIPYSDGVVVNKQYFPEEITRYTTRNAQYIVEIDWDGNTEVFDNKRLYEQVQKDEQIKIKKIPSDYYGTHLRIIDSDGNVVMKWN